ncbi:MAG: hypothetical protein KC503_36035, partial [Myxococcales bacterium]|nr:hypothetical protein [Myxococcales bacterium]
WEYIYKLHQGHDVYWDRMLETTPKILAKATPVVAVIFCVGLLVLLVRAFRFRKLLEEESAWLYWWCVAFTGVAVACTGYGTQWADFNAFIPGLVFPAIFAAIGTADLARRIGVQRRPLAASLVTFVFGVALAVQLLMQLYSPTKHIPRRGDRQRARALIATLSKIRGEILFPYHPFLPHLAGKDTHYHQMGINDVTRAGHPYPGGIRDKIEQQKYGAILLDKSPVEARYGFLLQTYKLEHYFPATTVPLTVTGYRVRPRYLFVPKAPPPKPPRGARSVFDFEDGTYKGFDRRGNAWGSRPLGGTSSNQQLAGPYSGSYLAGSGNYGDSATGTLRSPEFVVDRPLLTYRVGGGNNKRLLQVKLIVDGKVVYTGTGTASHVMETRRVDVSRWRGKRMRLELVDNARGGSYGYLLFDDLMLRRR